MFTAPSALATVNVPHVASYTPNNFTATGGTSIGSASQLSYAIVAGFNWYFWAEGVRGRGDRGVKRPVVSAV
jgi:hypothetical protein